MCIRDRYWYTVKLYCGFAGGFSFQVDCLFCHFQILFSLASKLDISKIKYLESPTQNVQYYENWEVTVMGRTVKPVWQLCKSRWMDEDNITFIHVIILVSTLCAVLASIASSGCIKLPVFLIQLCFVMFQLELVQSQFIVTDLIHIRPSNCSISLCTSIISLKVPIVMY